MVQGEEAERNKNQCIIHRTTEQQSNYVNTCALTAIDLCMTMENAHLETAGTKYLLPEEEEEQQQQPARGCDRSMLHYYLLLLSCLPSACLDEEYYYLSWNNKI